VTHGIEFLRSMVFGRVSASADTDQLRTTNLDQRAFSDASCVSRAIQELQSWPYFYDFACPRNIELVSSEDNKISFEAIWPI
jgi:hypothetical protein